MPALNPPGGTPGTGAGGTPGTGAGATTTTKAGIEGLRHDDPEVRRQACRDAVESAAKAESGQWIDALIGVLADPEKAVVRTACDALVAIDARCGGAEGALEAALSGHSLGARFGAAFALARIRPPDSRLLPTLFEALSAPDGDVRWAASRLLVTAGRRDPGVAETLTRLLTAADSPAARRMAAFGLRELGSQLPSAADALIAATGDSDVHVRRAALHALSGLATPRPDVLERLIRALDDHDGGSRRIAALALGELGALAPERGPICQALERVCLGDDADLERAARRSLRRLYAAPPQPRKPGEPEA